MKIPRLRILLCTGLACLVALCAVVSAQEPNLSKEEMRQFLLFAKVVKSRQTSKGVTRPSRLTLSDGKVTHDAAFQSVDEAKPVAELASGRKEFGFVDSYRYNLAAYGLAELLGLDDMIPVTVERRWGGKKGSLSWWVNWKWDEQMRVKQKLEPPDPALWNQQIGRMRVFSQLVYDTDPNQTNVLISEDWKVWIVDFTRAFRRSQDLENPNILLRCDRQLLEKLRQLERSTVEQKTARYLNKWEVDAVMARRDKIVARFLKLIEERGEDKVLY